MKKIMLKVDNDTISDFYYEEQQEYSNKLDGYELYLFDEEKITPNKIMVGLLLSVLGATLVVEETETESILED